MISFKDEFKVKITKKLGRYSAICQVCGKRCYVDKKFKLVQHDKGMPDYTWRIVKTCPGSSTMVIVDN